jgi:hypothetical protein
MDGWGALQALYLTTENTENTEESESLGVLRGFSAPSVPSVVDLDRACGAPRSDP